MRYKALGTTGLFVSKLCLGTMTFGRPAPQYAAAGGLQQDEVNIIARRAIDAGINFIDTADVYSNGEAEEIVGRMLKTVGIARQDIVIATKMEHATGGGPNDGGASRYHIMHQVKASLKRLGTDHIDLYQVHGWDPATPVEETVRALDDLVRQGYVRYVGVSNWAAWQIEKALGAAERLNATRFQSVQAYYSLAGRELEREIVPMAEAERLGLMVYSPLAGGYLSGKYRHGGGEGRRATIPFPPVDESRGESLLSLLEGIAEAHHTSMAAIALAWLLHRPVVTSAILGLRHLHQLEDNLEALEVALSEDELRVLDESSAPPPEYPGWMLAMSSAGRQALLETGQVQAPH